ncbi:MAG: type II secretion system protein [Solirubrobacterales bacterium]
MDKEVQMLLKLRERMASEKGFTLIELLVVMLIIGILAAIAIPTFFNQKQKAQDANAKSMAHTAQTAIETYATDNNGSYAGATPALLKGIESTISTTTVTVPVANATDYTIVVSSPSTGNTFTIQRVGGTFTFPCTVAGKGGCPAGGAGWG